jgi:hypothetical protein
MYVAIFDVRACKSYVSKWGQLPCSAGLYRGLRYADCPIRYSVRYNELLSITGNVLWLHDMLLQVPQDVTYFKMWHSLHVLSWRNGNTTYLHELLKWQWIKLFHSKSKLIFLAIFTLNTGNISKLFYFTLLNIQLLACFTEAGLAFKTHISCIAMITLQN